MGTLILVIFGWLALGMTAEAASLDCGKAATKVEKLICGDDELLRLDNVLEKTYQQALEQGVDKQKTSEMQRQWLKELRNYCHDETCLKNAYEARINELKGHSSRLKIRQHHVSRAFFQGHRIYHFKLTKGKGVPVCDAYLKRLNTTKYVKPPYCDRPENDAIKGFTRLHRVPLSTADVHDLFPIIGNFMSLANQKILDWNDMNLQQRFVQAGQDRLTKTGTKLLQMGIDEGWAKIWRYEPPIDIDNDGVPDNIEVWQGSVLPSGLGGRQCGDDISDIVGGINTTLHQPQVAFVVTDKNERLNVPKTVDIFAHPKGGYRFYDEVNKKWVMADTFRPVGSSLGIFEYQGIFYFDTFFDSWGDIENKRKKDGDIDNTLAVFLRKDGKTKQICEYLMNERDNK
ncbi:MAG: hypothetical protein V4528_07400 [Pseudomonadota bacterium]